MSSKGTQGPSSLPPPDTEGDVKHKYYPALDGLRALAIIAVMLFHLHIPGFSLGFSGVNLFFVLSGFLITGILLEARGKPFYFRNFYVRRSLRIFPIYYLTIIGYFLLVGVFGHKNTPVTGVTANHPNPMALFPYYLAYVQTIPQIHSHYTVLPGLNHTWSLAIEEQFYWIWPAVVLVTRRTTFAILLVFLLIAAPLTRTAIFYKTGNPYLMIGILPDQLDALAIGALIALLVSNKCSLQKLTWLGWAAIILGLAALSLLIARTHLETYWNTDLWARQAHNIFLLSALAFLFGGVVALIVGKHPVTRRLETRGLVHIGKISYGIYMYHLFVFNFVNKMARVLHTDAEAGAPGIVFVFVLLKFTLAYGVALLSWNFIEFPINSLKDRFTKRVKSEGDKMVTG